MLLVFGFLLAISSAIRAMDHIEFSIKPEMLPGSYQQYKSNFAYLEQSSDLPEKLKIVQELALLKSIKNSFEAYIQWADSEGITRIKTVDQIVPNEPVCAQCFFEIPVHHEYEGFNNFFTSVVSQSEDYRLIQKICVGMHLKRKVGINAEECDRMKMWPPSIKTVASLFTFLLKN